jgi:hypothetical protein
VKLPGFWWMRGQSWMQSTRTTTRLPFSI